MSLFVSSLLGGSPAAVARRLIEFGISDIRQIGQILLTGAMVVLPVWIVLRLLEARRAR